MTIMSLTVKQPWAWLIFASPKDLPPGVTPIDVENRAWPIRHRGPLLISAASDFDRDGAAWLAERHRIRIPEMLPHGGAVGIVQVTDCVNRSNSMWFRGPWGFVLREPRPIVFEPIRGTMGLFMVTLRATHQIPGPMTSGTGSSSTQEGGRTHTR